MHCGSQAVHRGPCAMCAVCRALRTLHGCTVHQELHQGCALPTGDRAQCVGTVCCAPGARRAVHTPCTGCEVLGTLGFGDKM